MSASRTKYYRDEANGKLKGVCAGIAEYSGIRVKPVRVAFVLLTLLTQGLPILIYLFLAWIAEDKPAGLYRSPEDARFWQGVRSNTRQGATEVRSKLREIDRRLADMETFYTSRNTRLASEIESLR